jgi:putative tricarboxylic transport membrane protein
MPRSASLGLSLVIMLVAGYGIFAASGWPAKAALFPLAIGIPLFALAAAEALWTLVGAPPAKEAAADLETAAEPGARRRVGIAAAWILGFFLAVVLLGFPLAIPLFLLLYLKLQGGEGWALSIGVTLVVSAAFYGLFDALLHLPFQSGWLFSWLGLG